MLPNKDREAGSLLVELVISMSILSVGLLGFLLSFSSNSKASRDVGDVDDVRIAMDNIAEALRAAPFDQVYATYNGTSIPVEHLAGPYGTSAASVSVKCHVDETQLSPEFGPIYDIDGAGGLQTKNCSTTYKILPVQLTVSYATANNGVLTRNSYIVLYDD